MSSTKNTPHPSNAAPGTMAPTAVHPSIGAPADLTKTQWLSIEREITAFHEGYVALVAGLHTVLKVISSGTTGRTIPVWGKHKDVAALYAEILHLYPDITARVDPDVIDAVLAVNKALEMVKNDLEQTLPTVESPERRTGQIAWMDARMVRSAAKALPKKDALLTSKIASAEALLRRGKMVTTTASTAAKAQVTAVKSQQRATRAAAKATKAEQRAARAAQAHAERHPQASDVVVQPAGTPPPATTEPGTGTEKKQKG